MQKEKKTTVSNVTYSGDEMEVPYLETVEEEEVPSLVTVEEARAKVCEGNWRQYPLAKVMH